MAEHEDSLADKIADKFHSHHSSSSSDSYYDENSSSLKSKVFRFFGREKPLHTLFGGGKPADILLWRDKKISAAVLGSVTAVWALFEIFEYYFLTLICHLLILTVAVLFLWSNASTFINKTSPHIPKVSIPERAVLEFASALTHEINRGLASLRVIASRRDLKKFLVVIAGLWLFSILGSCCNFLTLFYISFLLLHTLPVLYEKYDDKVDAFAKKAMIEIKKHYAVFDEMVLSKIPRGSFKHKKKA